MEYNGKFVKGDDAEHIFASIDRVLTRLARRSCQTSAAVIPPVPIGRYWAAPSEDGVLLRYMFPAKGTICRAVVAVGGRHEDKKKKVIVVHSSITNELGSAGRRFEIKGPVAVMDMEVKTLTGDRLTITIDDPASMRDVWIALLWRPDTAEAEIKQLLIDELDKLEDAHALPEREI